MRNQAFAFLKPHAMGSQPVVNAVADRLEEAGVRVSHMERIGADRLVAEGLYDRHVGPVARAAREKFGLVYKDEVIFRAKE